MKIWFVGVAGAFLSGSITGLAQNTEPAAKAARLEEVAKSYMAENAFMGTVLVVEGDQTRLDKGYGSANLEWEVPNTPDVKFRLGSLTKQFTAALVLLLQQDGRLHIEDPVSQYLPDTPKAWEKITLAHLLGHTSGIPNFTSDKAFEAWCMTPHTHAEEMAFFRDKPLDFEPGSRFAYSNSNYEVLGTVVEKVSGQSYGDLLQERVCKPLGMQSTGLDTDELVLSKRAQGYRPGDNGLVQARSESMTVPWAAGSLYSTTGDLLRWERGLFGGRVLGAASLQAMTTPGKGNYGLGVEVVHKDGVEVVEHGGGIEGFNTHMSYVPERQIAVIVLSNVNGSAPDAMGEQLLETVLGQPVILASERKPVPIEKEALERFAGIYDFDPDVAVTIAVSGESLSLEGASRKVRPMMYQGAAGGHPRFFVPTLNAEVEFVPDETGKVTSLVLHLAGDQAAKKR